VGSQVPRLMSVQVMRSRIEPMKKVARTLHAHRKLVLNYFRARKEFSSAVIEGLNNKAQVTMRGSYEFRTLRVTEPPLSFTWQAARATTHAQILLTNQETVNKHSSCDKGFGGPSPPIIEAWQEPPRICRKEHEQ
jgi:hypothetical protein